MISYKSSCVYSLPSTTTLETAGKRDESVQLLSKPLGDATSLPNPPTTASLQQATRAFPTLEHSKDVTSDANSDSDTNFKSENPTDSEVVRKPLDIGLDDRQFKPIRSPLHQSPPSITPPPQIRVLNEHGLISSPEMGSLVETEIDEVKSFLFGRVILLCHCQLIRILDYIYLLI